MSRTNDESRERELIRHLLVCSCLCGEGQGVGLEVFQPEGQVEFAGGEVAGGDEIEDGFLKLDGEFGEGITGTSAGDGLDLIEAEPIVEGDGVGSAG